jgi:lipase ATG15
MRHTLVHESERADSPVLVYDMYPGNAAYIVKNDRDRGLLPSLQLRSRPAQIYRLADSQSTLSNNTPAKLRNANRRERDAVTHEWRLEYVSEPDVSDKETVLSLAKMSSDAYLHDDKAPDWLNYSAGFNLSSNFGWQDNRLRGHVFVDTENSTVIIAIKGTSAG